MKNINRAVISGNMTRDPELRRTQSGMAILTIGVAVNDSRKDPQTGEWKDFPNFIDCTLFGNRAEGIVNYLHKGTKVTIDGKLRWSQWEDKQTGQKRNKIEIVVDEIEFDNKQQNGQQGGYQQPQPAQQYQQAPQMQQGYYAPPQPQSQYQQQPQAQPQQMQQPQPAPQQQQMAMPMQQQPVADTSVYDDDIPF